MSTIYSKAWKVIAWLGPASDDSGLGMDYLSNLYVTSHLEQRATPAELESAHKIISREYWYRMWVLQELGLAIDLVVQCGSKSVIWWDLEEFARKINLSGQVRVTNLNGRTLSPIYACVEYRKSHRMQGDKYNTLISLLATFKFVVVLIEEIRFSHFSVWLQIVKTRAFVPRLQTTRGRFSAYIWTSSSLPLSVWPEMVIVSKRQHFTAMCCNCTFSVALLILLRVFSDLSPPPGMMSIMNSSSPRWQHESLLGNTGKLG